MFWFYINNRLRINRFRRITTTGRGSTKKSIDWYWQWMGTVFKGYSCQGATSDPTKTLLLLWICDTLPTPSLIQGVLFPVVSNVPDKFCSASAVSSGASKLLQKMLSSCDIETLSTSFGLVLVVSSSKPQRLWAHQRQGQQFHGRRFRSHRFHTMQFFANKRYVERSHGLRSCPLWCIFVTDRFFYNAVICGSYV